MSGSRVSSVNDGTAARVLSNYNGRELVAPYVPSWVWEVLRETGVDWYLTPAVLGWIAVDPPKRLSIYKSVSAIAKALEREQWGTNDREPMLQNKRIEQLLATNPSHGRRKPSWSKKTVKRSVRNRVLRKQLSEEE